MNILKVFDGCECETYLVQDESNEVLTCRVDGREYAFNVDWVPKNNLDWLAQIYSANLIRMRDNSKQDTFQECRAKLQGVQDFFKLKS